MMTMDGGKNKSFDDHWPSMHPVIEKMLRQDNVTRSEWQDIFWSIHNVCLWDDKGALKLLEALRQNILQFIDRAHTRVMAHQEDQALLKAYITEWNKFLSQCNYLPLPFGQLEVALINKQGASNNASTRKPADESIVRKLMLDSWNNSIFSSIKNRLQASAMKLVHSERNGEAFDSQLVIGVRESYVNLCSNSQDRLQIYRENFEKAYLDATDDFYRIKAPEQLEATGVQSYMIWADAKLREEEIRGAKYLENYTGSLTALSDRCINVLVTSFKDIILAECAPMIQACQTENLNLMFRLMNRVPDQAGINPMLTDLEAHIVQQGLADMLASAESITTDSEKYIERLLELYDKFSSLVSSAFNDDPRFLTCRDQAFQRVVNDVSVFKLELPTSTVTTSSADGTTTTTTTASNVSMKGSPESRCPELLGNYCDMLLRKTPLSRKLTCEQIEFKLRQVLLVLKYVTNKDVFMRYHKAHLTRRLILDSSADTGMEETMLEWLREVGMPADYVNKLARMFQDIKVSSDLNDLFRKEFHRDYINIKILNAGAWARASERVPVTLPVEVEDIIPEVEEFYKNKHSGRKLRWHHHMSNGTICFANSIGKYDLDVTTFQMAVLFCWNDRPNDLITLEDLKLATILPETELKRTLWSLIAFPKLKRQILLCNLSNECRSSPKDLTDSTLFWINQEFALIKNGKIQKRGKINLIGRLQLSTEKTREEENQSIVQLRIFRTQEAIVKILKMRKRITNAQLQTEMIEMLKNMFKPSKVMIKEQIEWLIERKYIRRDEDNIGVFVYVA